jgi:hypothetical protein
VNQQGLYLEIGLKTKGKLSVHFRRKRKTRTKYEKGSGIWRKRNENGKTMNGNGKENEGALSDEKGNGRGNSGKIDTKSFQKYNLERPMHLVGLYLHMKLGLTTYQLH